MAMRDKIEHAIQNQPCTVKDLKSKFGGDRSADRKVMEAVDQLVHDAIVSATGPCVVEFETDETGSLLGIANLETLVAQAEASVEPAVRVMWETIPSAERKNLSLIHI